MPKILQDQGAKRTTHHINRRVTQSVFRAFDFAAATGTPLNLYVTIVLSDQPSCCPGTAFEAIRHKYRDWLNYRTRRSGLVPPLYVYALENPSGAHPHAHWVLHIPAELRAEFERKLPGWVEKVLGSCRPSDCIVEAVREGTQKTLAKYIVKGTDAGFVPHFYLERVHAPQGVILGKRAGVSPSLGATVRKIVNFRPKRPRHWHCPQSVAA